MIVENPDGRKAALLDAFELTIDFNIDALTGFIDLMVRNPLNTALVGIACNARPVSVRAAVVALFSSPCVRRCACVCSASRHAAAVLLGCLCCIYCCCSSSGGGNNAKSRRRDYGGFYF